MGDNIKPKEIQRGAAMVEVAVLIALLALVAIPSIKVLGTATSDQFHQVKNAIAAADIKTCTPSNPTFPNC